MAEREVVTVKKVEAGLSDVRKENVGFQEDNKDENLKFNMLILDTKSLDNLS
ncbi:hypothetical protein SAY87_007236 [Trapa incisa]|uniref:Uncharacterized protein n=1 Tax=Trapa incisa TaxID=236973 RepID=A0AAN7K2P4_9MYRT|nr:hypothetical protein SAY87_007236 [Trapa incisa]